MRQGRTLTKPLTIESRQHSLLGLDLGEGIRRRILALGTLGFIGWIILTAPITIATGFLAARPDVGSLVILAPPIVLIMIGFLPDDGQPRRMRVTSAALRLRYLVRGYRPIIALGARDATRAERMSVLERLSPENRATENEGPTQRVIHRREKARLLGTDYVQAVISKGNKRARRRQA